MSEDKNNPTKPAGSGVGADDDRYLRYFDAEMRYLREAGKEFARSQPQGARRVGMTMPGARHDSVEQTYEGFAFLTSRLRMKLDDAAPEITDPLLDHLWPHTGRTIPSLTILECVPRTGEARILIRCHQGCRYVRHRSVRTGRYVSIEPLGRYTCYRSTCARRARACARTALR